MLKLPRTNSSLIEHMKSDHPEMAEQVKTGWNVTPASFQHFVEDAGRRDPDLTPDDFEPPIGESASLRLLWTEMFAGMGGIGESFCARTLAISCVIYTAHDGVFLWIPPEPRPFLRKPRIDMASFAVERYLHDATLKAEADLKRHAEEGVQFLRKHFTEEWD
jgi:hypothetical protein